MMPPDAIAAAAAGEARREAVMQPLMCVCVGLPSTTRIAVTNDSAGNKRVLLHVEHATGTCVHDYGEDEARTIRDQLNEVLGGIQVATAVPRGTL